MRVALADDDVVIRRGLVNLLSELDVDVVAHASTGKDLLIRIRDEEPDVALLDIRMAGDEEHGLDTAARLRATFPNVGILMLSAYLTMSYAVKIFEIGERGVGYLLKDHLSDIGKLHDALLRIVDGETVMDTAVIMKLMEHRRLTGELDRFTEREQQVLEAMAEGLSNRRIADRLFIDRKTVETHVNHIFSKLGLTHSPNDKRVLAVLAWLRLNVVPSSGQRTS